MRVTGRGLQGRGRQVCQRGPLEGLSLKIELGTWVGLWENLPYQKGPYPGPSAGRIKW